MRTYEATAAAANSSANGVARVEEDAAVPTNIMDAAYVGAFDVVKAMVKVSEILACFFVFLSFFLQSVGPL